MDNKNSSSGMLFLLFLTQKHAMLSSIKLSTPPWLLYMYVAARTVTAPTTKILVGTKSKRKTEATQDNITDAEVAKHFKMLSACLSTAATIRPPAACKITTAQTQPSNPVRKVIGTSPCCWPAAAAAATAAPCWNCSRASARGRLRPASCTLRAQTDRAEPFSSFSKYTPARPAAAHMVKTASTPLTGSPAAAAAAPRRPPPPEVCTAATPPSSRARDTHCARVSALPRSATEKAAVVRIFPWESSW
mmetsp:Transcript_5323/g.7411  ORF Transcript_5323/g.7411 Transcript_5323/m.7411 type:complete len:247 (-) Transcript_5323:272-1012(-)